MADDEAPDVPPFDGFALTAVDPAGPGGDRFWRRIEHDGVVPENQVRSVIQDLLPVEREERWARGPGTVGPPRHWERPHEIDEAIEERNPQFVLRNLFRHEMDAWPNDLWWQVARVRTTLSEAAEELEPARTARVDQAGESMLDGMSYDAVLEHKRAHQELTLHTPWGEFDWRRGPKSPAEG